MSSSSRSDTPTSLTGRKPLEIDITALITKVRDRPPLWDKTSRKYTNRMVKMKLWEGVSKEIVTNWSELRAHDKMQVCSEIQKKWRNVRDAFFRELATKNKEATGQIRKKKRTYVHFDALSFLNSQPIIRKKSSYPVDDFEEESVSIDEHEHKRKQKFENESQKNLNNAVHQFETVEIPFENRRYDEDISFAEMLVPMLKKLNDDQKHFAKIKILKVLHKAKTYVNEDFSE